MLQRRNCQPHLTLVHTKGFVVFSSWISLLTVSVISFTCFFHFSFPCLSESHWQARRMYVAERKTALKSHCRVKKKKRKIYLLKTVRMKIRIIHWRIPVKLWLTRTEGWKLIHAYCSNTVIRCKNVTVLKHTVQFLLENCYDSRCWWLLFLIDSIAVI